jgi:hypothetical protein
VNQEADNAANKPVLDPEGFQRLLAAAYLLQVHNDRQPSIRPVQRVGAGQASSFIAGTIAQERNPSVMMRERQLQAGESDAVPGKEIAKPNPYRTRLIPFVAPTLQHKMKVLLRRLMSWRTVEPIAIAIVVSMMMGLSIHRLSAVPGRTSLASGMLEEQSGFQPPRPADKALASSQAVVAPNTRQSPIVGEADIVAADIVIRHQKRGVNLLGRPGARLTSGRDAGVFDTVVEYGPDVKMWSRKSERATPNRLAH